jgi:plasmid maintenance system antidote protein VapI
MKRQNEIAKQLGISKSYLSMILNGDRRLTPELAERLQQVPGIHKLVNNELWNMLYTQGVSGSSPLSPTIWLLY